jgi:hypothetical protein
LLGAAGVEQDVARFRAGHAVEHPLLAVDPHPLPVQQVGRDPPEVHQAEQTISLDVPHDEPDRVAVGRHDHLAAALAAAHQAVDVAEGVDLNFVGQARELLAQGADDGLLEAGGAGQVGQGLELVEQALEVGVGHRAGPLGWDGARVAEGTQLF